MKKIIMIMLVAIMLSSTACGEEKLNSGVAIGQADDLVKLY